MEQRSTDALTRARPEMKAARRRAVVRGFTLLEVLVSLAVMALMLAAIVQVGGVSARTKATVINNIDGRFADEQATEAIIAQIKRGQRPDMPAYLSMRIVPDRVLSDRQMTLLSGRGFDLASVSLYSTRVGREIWRGQIIAPRGAFDGARAQ